MLEVACRRTLVLLGAEERGRGLGGHGGGTGRLGRRDDDKPVTLGLPGKVDDGVLDGVDDLDGDTLLLDTEDFQRRGLGLLGLGVAVDLDAKVRGLGLPVELDVRDVEEVEGTDNLLGGDAHETDLGRVASDFRGPVAEELLVLLDTLAAGGCGGPVKVHDTINLDRGLV